MGSTFHDDPFGMPLAPMRDTSSPLNMFSSATMSTNLFMQSQPQLIPTRLAAPASITPTTPQSPSMMKKLSANPPKKIDPFDDLLDLNDFNPFGKPKL